MVDICISTMPSSPSSSLTCAEKKPWWLTNKKVWNNQSTLKLFIKITTFSHFNKPHSFSCIKIASLCYLFIIYFIILQPNWFLCIKIQSLHYISFFLEFSWWPISLICIKTQSLCCNCTLDHISWTPIIFVCRLLINMWKMQDIWLRLKNRVK